MEGRNGDREREEYKAREQEQAAAVLTGVSLHL